MNWDGLLDETLWLNIALVLGATFVSYLVLQTVLKVVTNRLRKLSKGSPSGFAGMVAEMLSRTSQLLLIAMSLLIGLKFAELPDRWESAMSHGWFIALAFQIALWLDTAVHLWMESLTRDGKARNPVTTTIIGIMLRIVVWTMMLLSILANLGVDITAMVASLGVGGIAIALAVQTLLSDIFASLSIGIDKPFEIGDFVVFGDIAGTIEHIGLKTTRIRSLSGEQISVSNDALLNTQVRNFKRMVERRIVFDLHAHHGASSETLLALPRFIAETIEAMPRTRFDRAHLADFDELGARFEIVYYVLDPGYNVYMDIQQNILAAVAGWCERNGLRFPHPTTRFVADAEMLETMAGMLAGSHQREGASP